MESSKPKVKSPIKPRKHALKSTKNLTKKLDFASAITTTTSSTSPKNSPLPSSKKSSEISSKTKPPSSFKRSDKRFSTTCLPESPSLFFNSIKFSSKLEQNENFRQYMEDYLVTIAGFNKTSLCYLFCIFDGHGGKETAEFCSKHFPTILQKKIITKPYDVEDCLEQSFLSMEKELEKKRDKYLEVGNTATVAYIDNKVLWVANVGDSSCLLVGKNKASFVSIDDDFANKEEIKRVEKLGGKIIDERLEGELAVSRSIGDFGLKGKGLICTPHIKKIVLDANSRYCILASDGIWDDLGPEDVLKICNEKKEPDAIVNELVKKALESGSEDNISCIVVQLNNN